MPIGTGYDDEMLVALIDHHSERLEVEYKAWINLGENEARAKVAQHLCALANYGGGWLVFGVNDDGSPSEPHPGSLDGYSPDTINSIVGRYLIPPFHCTVRTVPSAVTGKLYPVVQVPPHGAVPVCGKRSRPDGASAGILKGVHYTRAPAPTRSAPIDNPELWREVIHRCVVNDKEGLLASISRLVHRPVPIEAVADVDRWLNEAIVRWDEQPSVSGWPVDLKVKRIAFAFRLLDGQGHPVRAVPPFSRHSAAFQTRYARRLRSPRSRAVGTRRTSRCLSPARVG